MIFQYQVLYNTQAVGKKTHPIAFLFCLVASLLTRMTLSLKDATNLSFLKCQVKKPL